MSENGTPGACIDAHPGNSIDERNSIRTRRSSRDSSWPRIAAVGREFHYDWKRRSAAHRSRDIRDILSIRAKDGSPGVYIGTGNIDFDTRYPLNPLDQFSNLDKFLDAFTRDIDDHRRLPCCPYRRVLFQHSPHTGILQADSIEQARSCFVRTWVLVPTARQQRSTLTNNRAQPVYLGDLRVFNAIPKGARRRHHRIAQQ